MKKLPINASCEDIFDFDSSPTVENILDAPFAEKNGIIENTNQSHRFKNIIMIETIEKSKFMMMKNLLLKLFKIPINTITMAFTVIKNYLVKFIKILHKIVMAIVMFSMIVITIVKWLMKPKNDRFDRILGLTCNRDKIGQKKQIQKSESEPIVLKRNILICVHGGNDTYHETACEILKTRKEFHAVEVLVFSSQLKRSSLEEIQTNMNKFLKGCENTRPMKVTIPLFCHGLLDSICRNEPDDFFKYFLEPIREKATQILIFDGNCFSGDHAPLYIKYMKNKQPIDVEIYLTASCKGAICVANGGRDTQFIGDVPFDLIIGRIAFPSVPVKQLQISNQEIRFINGVWEARTFSSLTKIFEKCHWKESWYKCDHTSICYAYHTPLIRINGAHDDAFSLKSWFGEDYSLTPVFRSTCLETGQANQCVMDQLYFSHVNRFFESHEKGEIKLNVFFIE